MRRLALALLCLALASTASAECDGTGGPSHTLYVPWFEVDLVNPAGVTTLFAISSASSAPQIARVTLWTQDRELAAFFHLNIPRWGTRTVNARDLLFDHAEDQPFSPLRLCEDERDPESDEVFNFAYDKAHLRRFLSAQTHSRDPGAPPPPPDPGEGKIAQGFISIETVAECLPAFDPPLVDGELTGDFFWVDPSNNFAQGNAMPREPLQSGLHTVRFARGDLGPFDGTRFLFFSPNLEPRTPVPIGARDESGARDFTVTQVGFLGGPTRFVDVRDLGPSVPFGGITVECLAGCWTGAQWTADGRYSVAFPGECH